jgi:hypothetical protein
MNDNTTQTKASDNSASKAARGRERLLSLRIRASSLFSISVFAAAALLTALSVHGNQDSDHWLSAATLGLRDPASRPFPNVAGADDADEVLTDYRPYVEFILAVGQSVDPRTAKSLKAKWTKLQEKRNRASGARYLRLLKFEMDQHLQLTGGSSKRMHSDTPAVRAWVKRFIKDWNREAEEHLFRQYALAMAEKNHQARAE